MAAADFMDTVELIRNFWPEFQFQANDVKTCRPEFLEKFYTTFFAELKEKIAYLINEDSIRDELDEIQNFDKQIVLYCKMSKFYKRMGNMTLHLFDLYTQNPKKMYHFVRCATHCIIYLNNNLDEIYNVINRNYKKVIELEELKVLKEQYLQTNAEISVNLARLEDTFDRLKVKLEEVKKMHVIMLEDKLPRERIYAESVAEKNSLEIEINNLEYELRLLEDQEQNLRDHVITEREFECLRSTEKCLEAEYQRLCDDTLYANANIDKDIEYVKNLEQCAKDTEEVNLDCLNVEELQEVKTEAKRFKDVKRKFSEQLNDVISDLTSKQKNNKELRKTLEEMKLEYQEFIKKCNYDVENVKKSYENKYAKYVAEFQESQVLQSEILDIQNETQKLEEDLHKFSVALAEEYQAILNADKEATNKFYTMLLSIKKSSV